MKASVVVTSWNTRAWLARCLAAATRAADAVGGEVIVVDNGSSDGSAEMAARRFPRARLLRNADNLGFAAATNQGARIARGEHLVLLNSDALLEPDALARLVAHLDAHADYAAAVPRLVGEDGATQEAMMRLPRARTALAHGTPMERLRPVGRELRRYFARDFDYASDGDVEQPPAACFAIRRAAWEALGGFDESLFLFFNDVDLCARLAARGERVRYLADARVVHGGGVSTARFERFVPQWQGDRLRYHRKHFGPAGAALVKLAVSWTFADWWARTAWAGLRGRAHDALAPTTRDYARFLFHA